MHTHPLCTVVVACPACDIEAQAATERRVAESQRIREVAAGLGWYAVGFGGQVVFTRAADGYRIQCAESAVLGMLGSVPPPAVSVLRCSCGAEHNVTEATHSHSDHHRGDWLRVGDDLVRVVAEYGPGAVHRSRPVRRTIDRCPECLHTGLAYYRLPDDAGRLYAARRVNKTRHVVAVGETPAAAYRRAVAMTLLRGGSAAEVSARMIDPLPARLPCPHFACVTWRRGQDRPCTTSSHAEAVDGARALLRDGDLAGAARALGWWGCRPAPAIRTSQGERPTVALVGRPFDKGMARGRYSRYYRVMADSLAPTVYAAVDHLWGGGHRAALRVGTRPGDDLLVWPEVGPDHFEDTGPAEGPEGDEQ